MKTLLCYGDSNTYGYDPRSFPGDRYPADVRWTGLLSDRYRVIEAGLNGRTIPCREGEWADLFRMLERDAPDGLIVMLGTNDLLQSLSAVEAAERMKRFLTVIRTSAPGTPILLAAPPPVVSGAWTSSPRITEQSVRLGGCYQAAASCLGIAFADAGTWGVELLFDEVHFSPAGHRTFAVNMAKALEALM